MLTIKGLEDQSERAMIRDYTDFVLSRFVTPSQLAKTNILVKFIIPADLPVDEQKEFKDFAAWMFKCPPKNGKQSFEIYLNRAGINRMAMNPVIGFKKVLKDLGHELVHVKQYLNHEMFDYADGSVKFKGVIYPNHATVIASNSEEGDWSYFDSPWEVEAYGRMDGLYTMYKKAIKNGSRPAV